MATEDVQIKQCQLDITKYDLEINALIQDIRECVGPQKELDHLNAEVKQKLQGLRNRLTELEILAKEQDKESDKQELFRLIKGHQAQLARTQTFLRKANLISQLTIDKNARDNLLACTENGEIRQRQAATNENLVKSTSNLTENLMNISRMMANQVEHSKDAMQSLITSSKTLTDTHEEFKTMGGVIQNSHKLLTKYNRREFTDKVLIFLALAFFFATVLYIMKKRIFPSDSSEAAKT